MGRWLDTKYKQTNSVELGILRTLPEFHSSIVLSKYCNAYNFHRVLSGSYRDVQIRFSVTIALTSRPCSRFKSARLFGRNLSVWDFFLKVTMDFNQSIAHHLQAPSSTANQGGRSDFSVALFAGWGKEALEMVFECSITTGWWVDRVVVGRKAFV